MKCINPQTIFNKYLGRFVTVPCGHCQTCLIQKKNILSHRISNECDNYKYNIFFTLSYDNNHIPIVKRGSNIVSLRRRKKYHKRVYSKVTHKYEFKDYYKNYYDFFACNDNIKNLFLNNIKSYSKNLDVDNISNSLYSGVLYKKDINLFLKKLRYEIKIAGFEEKLYYAFVGEYGGKYNRPHYHGIIHTNNEVFAKWIIQNIIKIWGLSDINSYTKKNSFGKDGRPKLIRSGSVASYIAKYISMFDNEFQDVGCSIFKPFFISSKRPYYGLSKIDKEVLQNVFEDKNYEFERVIRKSNKFSTVSVTPTLQDRIWKRFDGIDKFNVDELCRLVVSSTEGKPQPIIRFIKFIRTKVKFYFNEVNILGITHVREYITKVLSFINKYKSWQIKNSMDSFSTDYLLSKLDSFSDIIVKVRKVNCPVRWLSENLFNWFLKCNIKLDENIFIKICNILISQNSINNYQLELNRTYIHDYKKCLLSKHLNDIDF